MYAARYVAVGCSQTLGEYISHPQECSGQSPMILPSVRKAAHPHPVRVPQSQLPSVFPQFVNGLQICTWSEQLQQHCGMSGSSKKHRTSRGRSTAGLSVVLAVSAASMFVFVFMIFRGCPPTANKTHEPTASTPPRARYPQKLERAFFEPHLHSASRISLRWLCIPSNCEV